MRTPQHAFTAIVVTACLAALPWPAYAQRAFEDADGDGSVFIDGGGFARANISDTSIRIAYLFANSEDPVRFGIELSGKAAGTQASLFRAGQLAPGAEIAVSLGRKWIFSAKPDGNASASPLTDDWLTFEGAYNRTAFDYLPSASGDVISRTFDGWRLRGAYNALLRTPTGSVIAGVSVGLEKNHNLGELDSVTVESVVSQSAGRRVVANSDAFFGDYRTDVHLPVAADLVWFPRQLSGRIGVDAFVRSQWLNGRSDIGPGVAVFLSKAGAPTRVIAGFSASRQNAQTRVGLVAGFNF